MFGILIIIILVSVAAKGVPMIKADKNQSSKENSHNPDELRFDRDKERQINNLLTLKK